jgi:hypothetical protein
MKLWLDDVRDPGDYTGACDWTWVKTAEEAISYLKRHQAGELRAR